MIPNVKCFADGTLAAYFHSENVEASSFQTRYCVLLVEVNGDCHVTFRDITVDTYVQANVGISELDRVFSEIESFLGVG